MNEALRGMSRMRNQFSVEKKKEKKKNRQIRIWKVRIQTYLKSKLGKCRLDLTFSQVQTHLQQLHRLEAPIV